MIAGIFISLKNGLWEKERRRILNWCSLTPCNVMLLSALRWINSDLKADAFAVGKSYAMTLRLSALIITPR